MMTINAAGLDFKQLNKQIRDSEDNIEILNCLGQRFIATGLGRKKINITGTPGNALGAYLNGADITIHGNAQDAVGDTMNEGMVRICGNIGDTAGYAMRGGKIYVRGNAGYRAGIHMKEYGGKCPAIVIGGSCGSFLGEYQAGGLIVVLGLDCSDKIVGDFPCTGMHGGKMFLRSECKNICFPKNVTAQPATQEDMAEIEELLKDYCLGFNIDFETITNSYFTKIEPDSKNPYKQMYVAN